MYSMSMYRGTKTIAAKPMTRGEYNTYRGWTIPADENPNDPGMLVEYTDGGKPNDDRHEGYISWSPLDVFEKAYKPLANDPSQLLSGTALDNAIAARPAPKVTPERIEEAISDVFYFNPPGTMLTICVLTLANGFNVTGESACASPENFDEKIGKSIAYNQAKSKIWVLEGYLLKQRLYEDEAVKSSRMTIKEALDEATRQGNVDREAQHGDKL